MRCNTNTSILFTFLLLTLISCTTIREYLEYRASRKEVPPGMVKLDTNFFCDQTEVSNLHWQEYRYWTERIFGGDSPQFLSTQIKYHGSNDTCTLSKKTPFDSSLRIYSTHPNYDKHPVIGITQNQAKSFGKWRADRVFQAILIRDGIMGYYYHNEDSSNYFTIERYFSGKYMGLTPDTNVKYYPQFRLPNIEERNYILHYNDSINQKYFDKCRSKDCKQKKNKIHCDLPCDDYQFNTNSPELCPPTRSTDEDCSVYIKNLRGNVSEWANEKGICFGGGWINSKERILKSDTFHSDISQTWIGFRMICEWKKVEDLMLKIDK